MPKLQVPDQDPRTPGLSLTIQADPVSVRGALKRLLSSPPLSDLAGTDRGLAEVVLAEVLNNVAEHAYGGTGGRVEVRLMKEHGLLRCLVVDEGRPMPGGQMPTGRLPGGPDLALDDLPEGGFGWHLIRSLSMDLTYARVDGKNRLSFALVATGESLGTLSPHDRSSGFGSG